MNDSREVGYSYCRVEKWKTANSEEFAEFKIKWRGKFKPPLGSFNAEIAIFSVIVVIQWVV